jgi:hypothetical protein
LAVDVYNPGGRWTAYWTREENGAYGVGILNGSIDPLGRVWVSHTLGAESLFPAGRFDLRVRVAGTLDMNRYLGDDDKFNLNTELGVQWRP